MAHSSEMRWDLASALVAGSSQRTLNAINEAEEIYQELFEIYNYAGASDTLMASLLFKEEIEAAGSPFEPTTEQLNKVADLRNAIVSLHQLFQALNNVAVTQADRATNLRRMS